MTGITLFNCKGLGEVSRMIFKYAGFDSIDNRFSGENWPKIQPNMPFEQTPSLTMYGKGIDESPDITFYAAKNPELVGSNDWENLEIDAIVDTINDFKTKIQLYAREQDAAIKETRKGPLFQETIPFYLGKLEQIAEQNDGHLAAAKLTWADFYLVGVIDHLNDLVEMNLLENSPNLQKVVRNVITVKGWIKIRSQTEA
ncbi:glutathione s-transferase [Holotrichia oblita]|uniref:Glutathione s-transferase n=1 Tax=Holotrichia oblita TaxID=644536 RepID=A0ACB9TX45_HOLOL|nr:glutathione s-transferase [Holotrichia oblita]